MPLPSTLPVRRSARVLLVDDIDRLLLLCNRRATGWEAGVWFTPGGGVDAGESLRAAAVRELTEETGLVVLATELRGPVWHRVVDAPAFRSDETFFLLRVPAFTVDTRGYTSWESDLQMQPRWWSPAELRAGAAETFAPRALPALVAELLASTGEPEPREVGW